MIKYKRDRIREKKSRDFGLISCRMRENITRKKRFKYSLAFQFIARLKINNPKVNNCRIYFQMTRMKRPNIYVL